MNSNFVDHELIAGFEWNMHGTQIDLTWLVFEKLTDCQIFKVDDLLRLVEQLLEAS